MTKVFTWKNGVELKQISESSHKKQFSDRSLLFAVCQRRKNQPRMNSVLSLYRARNNGRSTDNVGADCGFDRSNFRLAGHVDRSKFNRIENEINLRFLLFSCFSCYLSSRCVLRNFDMKSW